MPITGSNKQKLNKCSSTEMELVASHNFMPQILWTNYFLEAQGYKTNTAILYQDNKSTMLLKKNSSKLSSKCTKHIHCQYYFITPNCINNNKLTMEYCPTSEMVANYFTKPLQGKLFLKFCHIIMDLQ